ARARVPPGIWRSPPGTNGIHRIPELRASRPAYCARRCRQLDLDVAEVFPGFLSPAEIAELRACAEGAAGWPPGRQGSGYDILPLKQALPADAARAINS